MLRSLVSFNLNILIGEGAHNRGGRGRWGKQEALGSSADLCHDLSTLICLSLYDLEIGELVHIFPYKRTRLS